MTWKQISEFLHRPLRPFYLVIVFILLLVSLSLLLIYSNVKANRNKKLVSPSSLSGTSPTPIPTPEPTPTPTPSPTASPSKSPTPKATPKSTPPPVQPGGLGQIFPANNPWNQDISTLPVHSNSANFLASIGLDTGLHPDFGTIWNGAPNGIPYTVVGGTQPKVRITFTDYGDESDPGPYPIPANAPIEGGTNGEGDRHVIVIDRDNRKLYELFNAFVNSDGSWRASSGAIFNLASNALRPTGWTSADAAGLPIFPGLVRYDEAVEKGEITHALRFTAKKTQKGFIAPARHFASSSTDPNLPPMGLRVRLKATVDISPYPKEVQVILRGLKKYGMILADNGSSWFISGAPDSRWSDDNLAKINGIKGKDFEVVDTGPIEN